MQLLENEERGWEGKKLKEKETKQFELWNGQTIISARVFKKINSKNLIYLLHLSINNYDLCKYIKIYTYVYILLYYKYKQIFLPILFSSIVTSPFSWERQLAKENYRYYFSDNTSQENNFKSTEIHSIQSENWEASGPLNLWKN